MKYCSNCGHEIEEGKNFCANCGMKLAANSTTTQQNYTQSYGGGNRCYERNLGFADAFSLFWKKYIDFSGRARRKEYWYVVIWNLIITFAISIVQGILHTPVLSWIYALASLIPGIALAVRRLHDIGKSGWYYLFVLIPLVGPIILIVWFATDGGADDNMYGNSTKYYLSGDEVV